MYDLSACDIAFIEHLWIEWSTYQYLIIIQSVCILDGRQKSRQCASHWPAKSKSTLYNTRGIFEINGWLGSHGQITNGKVMCVGRWAAHMAAGSIGQKQTFSPWQRQPIWRICRINQFFGVAQCRTTTKWIYSIFGMRSNINLETLTIFRPLHPNARIVQ